MAHIQDLWFSPGPNGGDRPTARHGNGKRWKARYLDAGNCERSKMFARKADAERFLEKLLAHSCLVPDCRSQAVTEEPVLLCADHRDLVLAEAGRKRPSVHAPLVYFLRNGSRIKIGWTTNLRGRLASLALPASAIALTVDGGPGQEAILHARFAQYRVKGSEWFDTSPAIEAFIIEHQPAAAVDREGERVFLPPGWLTIEEVAEYFSVPVAKIRRWGKKGYGPKATVLGNGVMAYPEAEIERFESRAEGA